jgi:iron complex outermembrane recepter protein
MFRASPRCAVLAFAIAAAVPLSVHATEAAEAEDAADASTKQATDLDAVQVSATTPDAATGALGDRPLRDTPFSITRIDAADLAERQVNSLAQMFMTDPSVSGNVGAYNSSWYTTIQVRGLPVSYTSGYKINGMPLYTYGAEWPWEGMEQVQLLKGASAFMYGFGAPGGIVNYITKKPTDAPLLDLTVGYRDGGIATAHVDTSRRFGTDDRFGYRLNVVREQGDSYNDTHVERTLATLGFDARLSDDVTWTADLLYQDRTLENESPALTFTNYTDAVLPARIDPRRSRAIHDSFFNTEMQAAMTGLQWRIDEHWNARVDLSYSKFRSSINKVWEYVLNQQGDTDTYMYDLANRVENYMAQALVEGRFQTGPIAHQVVAGTSWQQADSGWARVNLWQLIGQSNLYQDSDLSYHSTHARDTYRGSRIVQSAVFASDTLSVGEHWSLLLGLRETRYVQDSWNAAGVHTARYRKPATTPTAALLFKPTESQTLYASYVESLEQGSTVGATYENRNEVLPPLESTQYEVGYKFERPGYALDAALFRIEKGAEYANAANYYVQDGKTRYQGVDVSARVQLTPRWSVGGGATRLGAEYLDNTAAALGRTPAGVPEFQATLNTSYEFEAMPGLSLHAAAKHYGSSWYGTSLYTQLYDLKIPAFTLLDAGAGYRTRWGAQPVTLRAEVSNLTDRRYWTNDTGSGGYGAPRTWSVSAQFQF